MKDTTITCPNCGGTLPQDTTICPDCQEDLSALARLEYEHAIRYNEALALARDGQFEEARNKLLVAIELDPSFVPAYVLLAKVYARQAAWADARQCIVRACDLAPEDNEFPRLALEIERAAQETEKAARAERAERPRAEAAPEQDWEPAEDRVTAAVQQPKVEAQVMLPASNPQPARTTVLDVLRAFGAGVALTAVMAFLFRGSGKD
ncbi:MAG: tetratricopeptide repeat protein [Anaerolineae bacterium]